MGLHDTADTDHQSTPKHEVMVWPDKTGGTGPLGTKKERAKIAGAYWDLYAGDIGWSVYSFVRVGNTESADFGLEAGTEVFTGKARLDTTAYSTNLG